MLDGVENVRQWTWGVHRMNRSISQLFKILQVVEVGQFAQHCLFSYELFLTTGIP